MVLGVGHAFVGRELLWGPGQLTIMVTPWVASWGVCSVSFRIVDLEGDGYQRLASLGLSA